MSATESQWCIDCGERFSESLPRASALATWSELARDLCWACWAWQHRWRVFVRGA